MLMEKYETIGVVGEGSYGLVMKCRHLETGQLVAIKKFLETEDDVTVRKMALREIRMLKRLRHENLVNLLEVFRRKRRFYLVFEFMDHTILDELEMAGGGLEEKTCKEHIYQIVRGIDFCHSNNVIHRDVKPENVLVSSLGVVKLCDFGFARLLTGSGETYTDYVATRWYRAPELLVPDSNYGKPVDIWAIGCLFAEMMAGEPLFPGDSDIDQLFLIIKIIGKLTPKHEHLASRNPIFKGLKKWEDGGKNLSALFPNWTLPAIDFLSSCLKMDPQQRPSSSELLKQLFFTKGNFTEQFLPELRQRILQEFHSNPLLRRLDGSAPRRGKDHDNFDVRGRRKSFIEPLRWKIGPPPDESRRPSVENTKLVNSSRSRQEPMEVENKHEDQVFKDRITAQSPSLPIQGIQCPALSSIALAIDAPKRSPIPRNPRQSHGLALKRSKFARRLDRPIQGDPVSPSPPPWLPCKRVPSREGFIWKNTRNQARGGGLYDDFSLPHLPGATCSPKKGSRKKLRDEDITPRTQPSLPPSASSKSRYNPTLPFM